MLNGSIVRPAHILLPLLLLISAFAIADDVNELIVDTTTPAEPEVPAFEISIVSPIQNQQITNSGIVLAVISPVEQATSAWFEIGNIKTELSSQNNFSSEFDSLQLPNGNYTFTLHACAEENCTEQSVEVEVANAETQNQNGTIVKGTTNEANQTTIETSDENAPVAKEPIAADENQNNVQAEPNEIPEASIEIPIDVPIETPTEETPAVPTTFVSVKGSNISSALTVFDLNGEVAGSGTGDARIKPSLYNARVDFFDSTFIRIDLADVEIDSNSDFFEIDEPIDANNTGIPVEIAVVKVVAINPLVKFASGTMEFNVPETATTLYKCKNWAFEERICNGNWEIAMENIAGRIQVPISPSDP